MMSISKCKTARKNAASKVSLHCSAYGVGGFQRANYHHSRNPDRKRNTTKMLRTLPDARAQTKLRGESDAMAKKEFTAANGKTIETVAFSSSPDFHIFTLRFKDQ